MSLPRIEPKSADWWTQPGPHSIQQNQEDRFDLPELCRKTGGAPAEVNLSLWKTLKQVWTDAAPDFAREGAIESDEAFREAMIKTRSEIKMALSEAKQYTRAREFEWVTNPHWKFTNRKNYWLWHLATQVIDAQSDSEDGVCARVVLGRFYSNWVAAVDPLARWIEAVERVHHLSEDENENVEGQSQEPHSASNLGWHTIEGEKAKAIVVRWDGDWTGDAQKRWGELLEYVAQLAIEDRPSQWVLDLRGAPLGFEDQRVPVFVTQMLSLVRSFRARTWVALPAVSRTAPQWLKEWSIHYPVVYARPICSVSDERLFGGKRIRLACGPTPDGLSQTKLASGDRWTNLISAELK